MDLHRLTAVQLADALRKKQVSAAEVAAAFLSRAKELEPQIDAFLHLDEEAVLAAAARADSRRAAGENTGPLAGVPVGIKDNICTKGVPTTCASKMLQHFVPPYSATAVEKLEAAGAVLFGKLNMDEFAMGSSCENSYFKPTKNPWDTSRVPGGSSGGSAAAVAAGQLPLALGSDTGGSIRMPAAFCGVVGLKPTYGAVSRYGLVAFASSLDQIGPLARTVDDCALLYAAICGKDPLRDATSRDAAFAWPLDKNGVKGLRIGLPQEYFGPGIDARVKAAVEAAVRQYETLGARVEPISLPSTGYALSAYYIISSAEASSNLARYDGIKYGYSSGAGQLEQRYETSRSQGFGPEVKRRILLGTYVLSSGYYDAYYKRAKLLQRQIAEEFSRAFGHCDVIMTPSAPTPAFRLGEKADDPVQMYASDVCTVPVNIAGLPAVSIPCGQNTGGLPVGLQIIGPRFGEAAILGAAKAYEESVDGFAVREVTA